MQRRDVDAHAIVEIDAPRTLGPYEIIAAGWRRDQHRLADLHEREGPDIPFRTWVAEKQLLTAEVEQLERRLLDSYANLIAVVKGELDKLTRAYDVVRDRVAELNTTIRRVSISNIERIELQVQESQLVEAIRQTSRMQLDLFGPASGGLPVEAAEQQIEEDEVTSVDHASAS